MDLQEAMHQAILRAWEDPEYKERLLKKPKEALWELGCEIPKDKDFKVLENNDKELHLILPDPPENLHELSEQEIEKEVEKIVFYEGNR